MNMNSYTHPLPAPPVRAETVEHTEQGVTLESLAEFKGLPVSELAAYGCSARRYAGKQAVAIPYLDCQGETLAVQYRTALQRNPEGADDRFRFRSGDKAGHLYGLDHLARAQALGWVLIVEGPSDCWTAWHYGLPAVGVPGKSAWKRQMAEQLGDLDIYVWQEPGAQDFIERIGRDLPNIRVIVAPQEVKDISEAHTAGLDVVALLEKLRQRAPSLAEIECQSQQARLPALSEAARPILECADPILAIQEALARQGYGGDISVPLLIYLAVTSRVLAMRTGSMPVHLLILGPASAGKSYALNIVLRLMPPEAYHAIDAGSPRVMIYDDADLAHRAVIFGEADSLPAGEDNVAASAVRNLLQDHRLHYSVTVRDPQSGDFTVREIEKAGPTTLITTSTRRLGSQLDSRVFILEVPDDHSQISNALSMQAVLELAGGTPDPPASLMAAQTYLQALAPWDVIVPFANELAVHLSSQPLETRVVRDFARLLSLIKACTVIRQARRARDVRQRLVADLEDYATVFDLVAEVYKASNGASRKVREVVQVVAEHLAKGHQYASQSDIRAASGLSKASVSRRVSDAKSGKWLLDDESRAGHPAKLRLGEALPSECGLPMPEELRRSTVSALTAGRSQGCFATASNDPAVLPTSPNNEAVAAAEHHESHAEECGSIGNEEDRYGQPADLDLDEDEPLPTAVELFPEAVEPVVRTLVDNSQGIDTALSDRQAQRLDEFADEAPHEEEMAAVADSSFTASPSEDEREGTQSPLPPLEGAGVESIVGHDEPRDALFAQAVAVVRTVGAGSMALLRKRVGVDETTALSLLERLRAEAILSEQNIVIDLVEVA